VTLVAPFFVPDIINVKQYSGADTYGLNRRNTFLKKEKSSQMMTSDKLVLRTKDNSCQQ
jgi:hypothetical protein